jgi:hypothetical protein
VTIYESEKAFRAAALAAEQPTSTSTSVSRNAISNDVTSNSMVVDGGIKSRSKGVAANAAVKVESSSAAMAIAVTESGVAEAKMSDEEEGEVDATVERAKAVKEEKEKELTTRYNIYRLFWGLQVSLNLLI